MTRRHGVLGATILAAIALGGCSQTAALAPVSGGRLAEMRFAVNDVLTQKQVRILVAPVCTTNAETVSCQGSTTDNQVVSATSSAAKDRMTVTVGSTTIYDGLIQDVLDSAARPTA